MIFPDLLNTKYDMTNTRSLIRNASQDIFNESRNIKILHAYLKFILVLNSPPLPVQWGCEYVNLGKIVPIVRR